jgi:hypothetical protein
MVTSAEAAGVVDRQGKRAEPDAGDVHLALRAQLTFDHVLPC